MDSATYLRLQRILINVPMSGMPYGLIQINARHCTLLRQTRADSHMKWYNPVEGLLNRETYGCRYISMRWQQVNRVVKKVFGAFAFIHQGIEYRSWVIMLQDVGKSTFGALSPGLVALL